MLKQNKGPALKHNNGTLTGVKSIEQPKAAEQKNAEKKQSASSTKPQSLDNHGKDYS